MKLIIRTKNIRMNNLKSKNLKPLLKWTGGKTQELPIIKKHLPLSFNNFFEPFLGGGAVWLSIDSNLHNCFVNDSSKELILLYGLIKDKNIIFRDIIRDFDNQWKYISVFVKNNIVELTSFYTNYKENINSVESEFLLKEQIRNIIIKNDKMFQFFGGKYKEEFIEFYIKYVFDKYKRTFKNEIKKGDLFLNNISKNIETGFKASFYMFIRSKYNSIKGDSSNIELWISFYFILRNYSYGGMFRYNKNGDFNVPYGGISYNSKSLKDKMDYFKEEALLSHLHKSSINNYDFEYFLTKKHIPLENDFIFVDPPYDTEFSAYDGNEFDKVEQKRLAHYLLNDCDAKWMIVIKYTDFIYDLYNKKNIEIIFFDKKYQVSFMDRNEQKVEHIIIKNY